MDHRTGKRAEPADDAAITTTDSARAVQISIATGRSIWKRADGTTIAVITTPTRDLGGLTFDDE